MSPRYADDQLDLSVTASPRLSRWMRLPLILLGLLLVPLSLPLAYGFAIISGGGHSSPFEGSAAEFAFGVTFIAVPFLVLLLGIASLACTNRTRLKIVIGLAAAVPATFALAVCFGYLASRPHEHPELIIPAPPLGPRPVASDSPGRRKACLHRLQSRQWRVCSTRAGAGNFAQQCVRQRTRPKGGGLTGEQLQLTGQRRLSRVIP